jgi:hypothetical protein
MHGRPAFRSEDEEEGDLRPGRCSFRDSPLLVGEHADVHGPRAKSPSAHHRDVSVVRCLQALPPHGVPSLHPSRSTPPRPTAVPRIGGRRGAASLVCRPVPAAQRSVSSTMRAQAGLPSSRSRACVWSAGSAAWLDRLVPGRVSCS